MLSSECVWFYLSLCTRIVECKAEGRKGTLRNELGFTQISPVNHIFIGPVGFYPVLMQREG